MAEASPARRLLEQIERSSRNAEEPLGEFGDEAMSQLKAECAKLYSEVLRLMDGGVVWIDGVRTELTDGLMSLTPGKHLVQIPGFKMTTVWVHLRALDPGEANTMAQMDDDTMQSEQSSPPVAHASRKRSSMTPTCCLCSVPQNVPREM